MLPTRQDQRNRGITPGNHSKLRNLHGKCDALFPDFGTAEAAQVPCRRLRMHQGPDGADLVAGRRVRYSLGTAEERDIKSRPKQIAIAVFDLKPAKLRRTRRIC